MQPADPHVNFDTIVTNQIERFTETLLLRRVSLGTVTMAHYHAILSTLFHQTYSSPYSFARAAVNCTWRHEVVKEYLLKHAEEERKHWRWVLDDLAATGFKGPNPRELPPHPSCQAYIGLNYYVAEHFPVARLATALVLEGIGAAHGKTYGCKLLETLHLTESHASFFLSHAETDKTHTVELRDVIACTSLSDEDWRWMNYAAEMAGLFYHGMYNHDAFS